jgi:hypothetical protein
MRAVIDRELTEGLNFVNSSELTEFSITGE